MQHNHRRECGIDQSPAQRNAVKSICNPWFTLSRDTVMLGLEAQNVIGLRMMKAVMGGDAAHREVALMVAEKAQAAVDVQLMLAKSTLAGEAHLAPGRALALYRRRVNANQRRLVAGG
jgi:hypothetical protein